MRRVSNTTLSSILSLIASQRLISLITFCSTVSIVKSWIDVEVSLLVLVKKVDMLVLLLVNAK